MRKRLSGLVAALTLLAGVCGAVGLRAQATRQVTKEVVLDADDHWDGQPYVLSLHGKMHLLQNGRWNEQSRLMSYAQMHKGEGFLLFERGEMLYRLDRPAEIQALAELYQPMEHLASLQWELASSMAPLSAQQAVLAARMRATRDYVRIGREQGAIGRRQGEIGREQGVIGREQGVLGRVLAREVQEAMDRCLKEKSCQAIEPAAPAAARR